MTFIVCLKVKNFLKVFPRLFGKFNVTEGTQGFSRDANEFSSNRFQIIFQFPLASPYKLCSLKSPHKKQQNLQSAQKFTTLIIESIGVRNSTPHCHPQVAQPKRRPLTKKARKKTRIKNPANEIKINEYQEHKLCSEKFRQLKIFRKDLFPK